MMNPQWIAVLLILGGQLVTAVWIVATMRGRVIRAQDWATAAYRKASQAHGRIDNMLGMHTHQRATDGPPEVGGSADGT